MGTAKYIDREALVGWLKHIPLIDLSDGHRFCRVIFEDDFKKAIKEMPKGIIVNAVPVVRCKDCIHSYDDLCGLCCTCGPCVDCLVQPEFYCAYGERKG